MKLKIKKIIREHKTTFPKAIVEGFIITMVAYSLGVLFVDYLHIKYSIIGLVLIPFTFTIKYILNKYWVYKNNK